MNNTDAGAVDRRTPEEAFTLLDNETRIAILQALGEADDPLTFSALRERVGERDSGKFNYHLGKLTGHFVRRTEGEEGSASGYELTLAGSQVVGALLAGTYTADVSLSPIEIESTCPMCGGTPLLAEYEDEHVKVSCTQCDPWLNQFTFPPGTVEQFEREELPDAFDRWLRTTFQRVVSGFCSTCSGRMTSTLKLADDRPEPARAVFDCERCGDTAMASPSILLFYHPAAMGFFYDHGIDVTTTPTWEVGNWNDLDLELLSEDPITVQVTMRLDDETIRATVNEHVRIETIDRTETSDD